MCAAPVQNISQKIIAAKRPFSQRTNNTECVGIFRTTKRSKGTRRGIVSHWDCWTINPLSGEWIHTASKLASQRKCLSLNGKFTSNSIFEDRWESYDLRDSWLSQPARGSVVLAIIFKCDMWVQCVSSMGHLFDTHDAASGPTVACADRL